MDNMEDIKQQQLGPHVTVTPEGLIVDFGAIREETIERYGFAEKPADEPWIIGKLSQEDFGLMKEEEQADESEEKKEANQ